MIPKDIRFETEVLSEDYTDNEPITRFQTLLIIRKQGPYISRTLYDLNQQIRLVSILTDMISSEEYVYGRNLAALCLGWSIGTFGIESRFPIQKRRLAFEVLKTEFLKYFPNSSIKLKENNMFDIRTNISKTVFDSRIQLLHALSLTFNIEEAKNSAFLSYIDELFITILSVNSHPFLMAAVIHIITNQMDRTIRNRLRVEHYFRQPIQNIVNNQKDNPPDLNKPSQLHLFKCLSAFMSTWYPPITDATLLFLDRTMEFPIEMTGFASERLKYLTALDTSETVFEELSTEQKKSLIQLAAKFPYNHRSEVELEQGYFKSYKNDYPLSIKLDRIVVPSKDSLTFRLKIPIIDFNQAPQTTKHYLENCSSEIQTFVIQASHPEFFKCSPSYGTLNPSQSIQILTTFTPNPYKPSGAIKGYIQVRNMHGFPFERVALNAMNLPAVKVSHRVLNFGRFPAGDSRICTFSLTNLLSQDCNAVIVMKSTPNSNAFQIQQTQVIVPASDTKYVSIKATFTQPGPVNEQVIIIALAGQLMKINLKGYCGEPLSCLEEQVNFGPTDIFFKPVEKRLKFINLDLEHSLPITAISSTNELTINNGNPIILKPNEQRTVIAKFTSNFTGERKETLKIEAPNSKLHTIKIKAFSGPYLKIPVQSDIYAPAVLTGQTAYIRIPVSNLSSENAFFTFTSSTGYPVVFKLLPGDYSNPKAPTELSEKQLSQSDMTGIKVTLSPSATCVVEVAFTCTKTGFFKIPLRSTLIKPYKMELSMLYIHFLVFDESLFTHCLNSIEKVRNFSAKPFFQQISPIQYFDDPDTAYQKHATSQIFRLDAAEKTIFGSVNVTRLRDTVEFLHLINLTAEPQRYRITLSTHFKTDLPLEGEVPPATGLGIPIRFDPAFFTTRESIHFTALGAITILDSNFNDPGMVSAQLTGIIGDLLCLEVRDIHQEIQFPFTELMQQETRTILIRNKSSMRVSIETRIDLIDEKGMVIQATIDNQNDPKSATDWNPFTLQNSSEYLKPFEVRKLNIVFKSNMAGEFKAKLSITYKDPYHKVEYKLRGPINRSLIPLIFSCAVGTPQISHQPDYLAFGDGVIGNGLMLPLSLSNMGATTAKSTIVSPLGVQISPNQVLAKPKSKSTIDVKYFPSTYGPYQELLNFSISNTSRSIPVIGYSGICSLTTNIASPFLIDNIENLEKIGNSAVKLNGTVDFGEICFGSTMEKQFFLENKGTLDIRLAKMESTKDQLLSIDKMAGNISKKEALDILFDISNLDLADIDLDLYVQEQRAEPEKRPTINRTRKSLAFAKRTLESFSHESQKGKNAMVSLLGKADISEEVTISNVNSILPLRLAPLKKLAVKVTFRADELGTVEIPIVVKSGKKTDILDYILWFSAYVALPLALGSKRIDFGIVPTCRRQRGTIKFTNEELKPVSWELNYFDTLIQPIEGYEESFKLPSIIRNPVILYPTSGTLAGGATQTVEIMFSPSIAEAQTLTTVILKTANYNEQTIQIEAIAASCRLYIESNKIDFGTIRVGAKKTLTTTLYNNGMLPCSFYIDCSHRDFLGEPEGGLISANDSIDFSITFSSKTSGKRSGNFWIRFLSDIVIPPIQLSLIGVASYPKLSVISKVVDFGTALYRNTNIRKIEVANKGAAEAKVVFQCNHPDITLEDTDEDCLTVPPNQNKWLTIIYKPLVVEKLNSKAFIRSSDSRGETFMVVLKGNVGIPKLSIYPPNALDDCNFGVMRLHKPTTKKFTIVNDGTIFLNFRTKVIEISVFASSDINRQNVLNVPCPITVTPCEGNLGVGESCEITIKFVPTQLLDYTYEFQLVYEYQEFSCYILGVGGRSLARIANPENLFDFELCRLNRTYEKKITIVNHGNLGFAYHIRPEPKNGDWDIYMKDSNFVSGLESESPVFLQTEAHLESSFWIDELQELGLSLVKADGYLESQSKLHFVVRFTPKKDQYIEKKFRFYQGDRYEDFIIKGRASQAAIHIRNPQKDEIMKPGAVIPDINIGVHPVGFVYNYVLELVNGGPFGVDFLLEPMSSAEFDLHPLRGFIEPNQAMAINVIFQPTAESKFHALLKVIWEGAPILANIYGDGGVGRLDVTFIDEKDILLKSLDFGMVPFNTPCKKRFFLLNYGMVGVNTSLKVENEVYGIALLGDVIPIETMDLNKTVSKSTGLSTWFNSTKVYLPANTAVQIGTRFLPRSSTTSVGDVTIRSDSGNFTIPLKGKGGTLSLSHKGDLDFGDISCNYTYTRKITISNAGSIPSTLNANWLVVGYASDQCQSHMSLTETYSLSDPRSQWARLTLLEEKNLLDFESKLTAKDHWRLILLMIKKTEKIESVKKKGKVTRQQTVLPAEMNKLLASKNGNAAGTAHFKRRQMFYHLITSTQVTSQSVSKTLPFIKVTPPVQLLPSYGEVVFLVELNLGTEDTFLATLSIKSDIPNSAKYEVALTATPKIVNILCDDTRILNFYRQPLGEMETITRRFTNLGHKDIPYKFINTNASLTISPAKGLLKVGGVFTAVFSFKPTDESTQSADVIFDPLFSYPIRFKMFGGGGYAKASLSRYRRFDFGHCMIGKDTVSHLPITNEGNAILHLVKFELIETDTFFKGKEWPKDRISLFPGVSYNLPLVFNPHEENPTPGSLVIGTSTETFEIELIGLGREAVLIVSKIALEFSECLIGNTYEQKLGLKNIGDVNYPVSFHLEKEFSDISFNPTSLTINPFSENFVVISYSPTSQTKSTVVLTISSPYSSHKVPLMVHAGTAFLEFNSSDLTFGMFERTTKPSITLQVRNTGTVKTSFQIKDIVKPSRFSIEPAKGILFPKKSIDIKINHIRHEVAEFEEKLAIKTDLVNKIYFIKVSGQCEETVLHPDEFSLVSMGVCPVLEPTTKPILFKNYGKFPLTFEVQSAYPLKVSPTSGEVLGNKTGTIYVTWSPSGGYELRTQLIINTNIGKFQVLARGKSLFPEMFVSTLFMDFGVCALGHSYHQSVRVENRGKVKLHFTIPACKESSYLASVSHGVLEPKESTSVDVLFLPKTIGKIPASLIIDCKGIHYKEIVLVGMGGILEMDISPKTIDLERCPFGLTAFESLKIHNKGDVSLSFDFSSTKLDQGVCEIIIPEPFTVPPKQQGSCMIGFLVKTVDRFYCKVSFASREQSFLIPATELTGLDPFYQEPKYLPLDFALRRFHRIYIQALEFYEALQSIYQQQFAAIEFYKDMKQIQFSAKKRISFLSDVDFKKSARDFRNTALEILGGDIAFTEVKGAITIGGYGKEIGLLKNQSSSSNVEVLQDPNEVQEDQPETSEEGNNEEEDDDMDEEEEKLRMLQRHVEGHSNVEILAPYTKVDPLSHTDEIEDTRSHMSENISMVANTGGYNPPQSNTKQEKTFDSNNTDPNSIPAILALDTEDIKNMTESSGSQDGSSLDAKLSAIEQQEQKQESLNAESKKVIFERVKVAKVLLKGDEKPESLPSIPQALPPIVSSTPENTVPNQMLSTGEKEIVAQSKPVDENYTIDNTLRGMDQLSKDLKRIYNPFLPIDFDAITDLTKKFVAAKTFKVEPDVIPDDPIITEILEYGHIKIEHLDLDPILTSPLTFDPLDLGFLLARPPPICKEQDNDTKNLLSAKKMESRKAYLSKFPTLDRSKRNAHSNPFNKIESRVKYGTGVRLYTSYDPS
ncbi:hypothetical protein BC833DRAFT_629307 [Globomyces pollinis-pini]|nr:hypothetical protein BC833DRAFT_629307 [Globomyces pollinis-pini]